MALVIYVLEERSTSAVFIGSNMFQMVTMVLVFASPMLLESLAESINMRLGEYDGYKVVGVVFLVALYGMVVEISGYH